VKNKKQPSRRQATVLRQLVELIPSYLVPKLARVHGVDLQSRTFSPWSHVVALLYAQMAHALSLNDVCDGLRLWATPLRALRGASAPSRNNLSHANKTRDCAMAEDLFWRVLSHLQSTFPAFGRGRTKGLAWRFHRTIHVVDATVIQLVASCLDWAKHRRRKAAAKCHMRLSLRSMLPGFVVIDAAREHDIRRARQLCAGLHEGEIVLFDKGYYELAHFRELAERGISFVTRAKDNIACRVRRRLPRGKDPRVLKDELIVMKGHYARQDYPGVLRRVTARVELDGQERILVFLTNNLEWSGGSVADLYRCRWQIEVFFKQVKQTLQLADFFGQSANAVKWQVWMALLVYVLLRFQAWRSAWTHSFSRLLTLCRAALWLPRDLGALLTRYGTAGGRGGSLAPPRQSELPGFAAYLMGQHV
jgi:IS5 family transposase